MSTKAVLFTVLAVVICVTGAIWHVVSTRKKQDLLSELRTLHEAKIERISINDEGAVRDITNEATIDTFGRVMVATEFWQPQQPLMYKNYKVVIYVANAQRIEVQFSLDRDRPDIVFIYFNKDAAGRFKNKPLYGWLQSIDLAP